MGDALDRDKLRELLDLTGGETAWLRDLLATYVADTTARLADLRSAVGAGHAERVQRAAHGIKGSSSNVGAARVAAACHAVELAARSGDLGSAAALVDALHAEFEQVRAEIPVALPSS